jgi:hypothetical protein
LATLAAFTSAASVQKPPGAPEENGLTPKSATYYVNSQSTDTSIINNGNTESLGVAIANGGNIIVGWEDDAEDSSLTPLQDQEAVWTIFDSAGVPVTTNTDMTALSVPAAGSISGRFLSYFRADKSAVVGATSWGPKIKANLFGDGLGMGATSFLLGEEVVAFAAYDDQNMGDFPSVQLLGNDGQPAGVLGGVSAAYATQDGGNIRIGDWDYLSNGNILIVGESRQNPDLVNLYGGSTEATHVIFRIVDATGKVIKAETLVSETPDKAEMWHGSGVTKDGFAIRFMTAGTATVRLFNNSGTPISTNINIAELTGNPIAGGGGRGDSAGFHGNGTDAYVIVNTGTDSTAEPNTQGRVWLTVLNTNGVVRYSKSAIDDINLISMGSADAAIGTNGEVLVVFAAKYSEENQNAVMGRRFDASGKALGGTFYVSELELLDPATPAAGGPRIAWRSGQAVVVWQSKNDPGTLNPVDGTPMTVVGMRIFSTFAIGSIESAGLKRIVADKPLSVPQIDALGNWEPYVSVLGTSTFLIEGSTFAQDYEFPSPDGKQRYVVALQPVDGKTGALVEGFYTDAGQPFNGPINASRQNGNPGRVAGDTRPGAVNYMVGAEASPHTISPEFASDNRWNLGFDRLSDGRYGTVQIFKLASSTLTPTPLSKALDSATGRMNAGVAAGNQISRFGGDIVCLDNGNFASVVEDRSRAIDPDADCVVATIFAPDGSIVKDSWEVVKSDIWANVAPFKGGFAIRAKPLDASASRVIYFYDNAGTLKGTVDQTASGASFDTGRGDGTRLFGHINSPFVYLVGKVSNTTIVKVAAFDSRNQQFVAIVDASEGAFTGNFDRAIGAVDALNRLTVSWVAQPTGYANQQVAARVFSFNGTNFTALTSSFFAFVNYATNDIRSVSMNVAMTTKQICIAAKGEINLQNKPELGKDSPKEVNFYTVFTHPSAKDDPTTPAGGVVNAPTLKIERVGSNVTLSWDAAFTGFTLESKAALADATWTTVGVGNPVTQPVGAGSKFYRLRK